MSKENDDFTKEEKHDLKQLLVKSALTDEEKHELRQRLKGINVANLVEQVRSQEVFMRETREMIVDQNKKISGLIDQMNNMESSLNTMRITKMGSGPTQT